MKLNPTLNGLVILLALLAAVCGLATGTAYAAHPPNLVGMYSGTFSDNFDASGSLTVDVESQNNRTIHGDVNIRDSAQIRFNGKISPSGQIVLTTTKGVIGKFTATLSTDGKTLTGNYSFHRKKATFVRTGTFTATRP